MPIIISTLPICVTLSSGFFTFTKTPRMNDIVKRTLRIHIPNAASCAYFNALTFDHFKISKTNFGPFQRDIEIHASPLVVQRSHIYMKLQFFFDLALKCASIKMAKQFA